MISILKFSSVRELIKTFSDEKVCHQFLGQHRWNTGVIDCAYCGHEKCYVFKDGIRYKCCECKKVFTATTNTFLHGTKLKIGVWIEAIWYILHKKGISSMELSRDLNVTQKTAWYMLQKIRIAMGNEIFRQLEGTVEIDEAFVGGKSKNKHKDKRIKHNPGRSWADKMPVIGMLERGGKVRAISVPNVQMLTLKKTVYTHIKPGSDLMGDGFMGYRALISYNMQCVDHGSGWYVNGDIHTNTIEGFWSQLKKGLIGNYHQVSKKHLNKYLNEFAFKYNYRNLSKQHQLERILWNSKIKITNKQLIAA